MAVCYSEGPCFNLPLSNVFLLGVIALIWITIWSQDAVQQVQYEMLMKLRSIREELANSKSTSASTKELEALRKENEDLKKQLMKSEYRIMHLVKNLEAAETNV